ncbi:Hsp70 family protein [Plantactinospora sonchi]|uniref:Hsp70 family protein n=1 Tax=Plantactinospora sonchi TaxID=1544735 RepID=A0ABU7RU43_9ACTN
MDQPTRLAIDLGTTHTVAVIRRTDQPPRTLLFDGSPLLSSAVHADPTGTLHTGTDAQRLGATDPQRYEPHPKRRIDDGTVLLGTHEIAVEHLLAATLRRVADEARTAGIDPTAATVLTCPADWGQPRRALLHAAATHAGLGPVHLLDEPVAAATHLDQLLGHQTPPDGTLAVFDLGGGTLDITVIRHHPHGPQVLATGGLDDLGGLDIDAALVTHLGHLVRRDDPALWHRLTHPDTPTQRRDRQTLWTEVRAAKEMLSRTTTAPVHIPGLDNPLHLTRHELDAVAGPLIARAVDETRRVLQRADVTPAQLTALLLVGGASRTPLVANRLHARLGVAPTVPEQPELPVAYGAIQHTAAPQPQPTPPRQTGTTTPHTPTTPAPPPVHRPHPTTPPTHTRPTPPPPSGHPQPTPHRRRPLRRALLTATALLTVAACVGTATIGTRWLTRALDNLGTLGTLGTNDDKAIGATTTQVATAPNPRTGDTDVVVTDDRHVISAATGAGSTEIISLPAGSTTPRWKTTLKIEPETLRLTALADLIVIDAHDTVTHDGDNIRAVISATDGTLRWQHEWPDDRTDIAYYGTDAIVEIRGDSDSLAILRVDLRTGKEKWNRRGEPDLLVTDEHRAEPMRQWPTTDPTDSGTLPATDGTLTDATVAAPTIVELDTTNGRGHVLDADTGKPRRSGALPLDDELWTAYAGKIIGRHTTQRHILTAYDATTLRPAWTVRLGANERLEHLKPCGPQLICTTIGNSDARYTVLALNTETGDRVWQHETENSDTNWYVHGGTIVTGRATFDPVNDPQLRATTDGQPRRELPEHSTVLATADDWMVLSTVAPGNPVTWRIHIEAMNSTTRTGPVEVGAERPRRVAINGDLVGVVTADRRTLVVTVTRTN